MYIGSTGLAGLHHLIWEVVDNAVDEAMAGFCTRIASPCCADGGCRVDDNGRGIPVDPYPSGPHKGKSAAEVVLTVLHAGGKFGGDGYKVSGGLHGVGVSVVNALSERLIIEVDQRRQALPPGVRQGRQAAGQDRGRRRHAGARSATQTGTTVTFWPDPTVFLAEGTEFVARTVLERLQTMAFLNQGLEIVFRDERPEREQTSHVPVQGRHRRLRQAPQRVEGGHCSPRSPTSRTTTTTARRSTSPSSGTPATTRASTATPTASPPSRAACTSRASDRAHHACVNKYARAKNLLKEKDENLARRGHPRGHHRDHRR